MDAVLYRSKAGKQVMPFG